MNSEESSFSPDHVEMAVLQFNKDPTNGTLNDYLNEAQLSTSAWNFVWALLRTDKHSEVQLYGADTLHLKISKHWQEVPADFVLSLRDRFFQLLSLYSDVCHRIVFKKLCLCLGCFILKTVTRQWSNALYELVASIVNPPGDNPKEKVVFQKNVMEILKTIPEELMNSGLPPFEKAQVVNELMNASNTVCDMINKVLAEDWPEELKEAAVNCFKSWCHSDIFQSQPENESLFIHLLDLLKLQKHSLEAADALVQFFQLKPNPNNSRVMKYLQLVTELGSFFEQQSHNIDLAQNLTKVFVSAAENNMILLLRSITLDNEHSAISLDLLQLLLRTVAIKHQYPTEELCSHLSLEFWFTLHDIHVCNSYPCLVNDVVRGLLLNLVEILIGKIRLPSENLFNQWEEEVMQHFIRYRSKLINLVEILKIGPQLKVQLVQILKQQITSNVKAEWQDFENTFFIMNRLTGPGCFGKLDCISDIYTLLSHIPCNHINLTDQVLTFVKRYPFIDEEFFDQSLAFILNFVNQEDLLTVEVAFSSLEYILFTNKKRISQVSEVAIQAIKQTMERPDIEPWICETLADCLGLVAAHVIQDLNPNVIQVILMPHINVLSNLAAATQVSNHDQNIEIDKLKIMITFILSFYTNRKALKEDIKYDFIFEFVTHILHYVEQMIGPIVQNEDHMMEVRKLLDILADNSVRHFEMMVPKLCKIIQVGYSLKPLSSLLFLAETLFKVSNREGRHWEALKPMYLLILEKSLQVFSQNPYDSDGLLLVFMSFMSEASREAKNFIKVDPNCMLILFRLAVKDLEISRVYISEFSLKFLKELIQNNDLIQIIKTEGQTLLENILFVSLLVAKEFKRYQDFSYVAGVLLALLDKHRQFVVETLTLILSSDRFTVSLVSQNEKEQFLKIISDSNITENKVSDALEKLALLWKDIPDPLAATK